MKQTKLALSAVMIVAVGLIGTNFVTGLEMTEQEKFDAISNSNLVYGHITIVHSGPDGNIYAYVQTDNLVAAIGKNCMSQQVFGNTDTTCTASTNTDFNTIALFKDETFPATMNATGFDGGVIGDGDGLEDVDLSGNGLDIIVGTVSQNTNATGTGSAKTDITKTFTFTATGPQTVNGAALFNDGEDAVLAGQVFSSVDLSQDDTLTITWTIELGA